VAATTAVKSTGIKATIATGGHTQKTFETKQSTIGDNSCNNPLAATEKSSGNYWQQ